MKVRNLIGQLEVHYFTSLHSRCYSLGPLSDQSDHNICYNYILIKGSVGIVGIVSYNMHPIVIYMYICNVITCSHPTHSYSFIILL